MCPVWLHVPHGIYWITVKDLFATPETLQNVVEWAKVMALDNAMLPFSILVIFRLTRYQYQPINV